MTSEEARANFIVATERYRQAKLGLEQHRKLASYGMENSIAHAVMVENTAHSEWLRAHEAYTALQPAPTPKPPAPKPVVASAKPSPRTAPVTPPARGGLTQFQEGLEEVKRIGVTNYRKRYGLSSPYSNTN